MNAMIIVTSRPAAASASPELMADAHKKIEVFGFSKSQVLDYIHTFPFSSSSTVNEVHSENLQRFLAAHPGVWDLCYLPINCAIICYICTVEPDNLPDTQTQIFALFTRLIILRQLISNDISRQLHSLEDLEGQEANDFKKLCSLAFDMTANSEQVVTKSLTSLDEAHSLGLVTTDITAGLCGYKSSYSFLHMTLQEFLAAYHLYKLKEEEQISCIEKYGQDIHMRAAWKFYFGLVNFDTGIERAEKLFANIGNPLFKIQCSFEARHPAICRLASSNPLHIVTTLSNYDLSAIAYTMSMSVNQDISAVPTTDLRLRLWGPGIDKLKTIMSELSDKALEHLESLDVSYASNVCISDLDILADKLKASNIRQVERLGLIRLRSLYLVQDDIGDEGVAVLAAGLEGNDVLKSLF